MPVMRVTCNFVNVYANSCKQKPNKKGDIKRLEKVQMRATKLVNNVKHLSCENWLKKLKLPTLKYRPLRGDMIEVYKIIHGKYDKTCSLELELY